MVNVIYGKTSSGANRTEDSSDTSTVNATPDKLFLKIEKYVEDSMSYTSKWSSKQDKFHKLRMRIKRTKTFPFVGSSNIRMPTAEIAIRKAKAGILGQVFGVRPVVSVEPTPGGSIETAQKIEKFLDHLVMDVIGMEPIAEILVDQSLEKGFMLAKPFWKLEIIEREEKIDLTDYQPEEIQFVMEAPREQSSQVIAQRLQLDLTDNVADYNLKAVDKAIDKIQAGETKFTLIVKDVICNYPDVSICSPERIYVPTDSRVGVQDVTTITHEFFLPLTVIKDNAKFKGWDKEVVSKLNALKVVDIEEYEKETDVEKNFREGIDRLNNQSQLVRVWETYGYCDVDGSGINKKSVVTSFPDFKLIARKSLIDTMSGEYPFEKFYYELSDDRWFNHRGIPELLEDIIKEIDVQHNMKIDSQTIRNAPMFVYRTGMVNPNLIGTIPNQAIPVNGLQPLNDTIQALNLHNPNTEFSYEKEQQILEGKVQEMVGQVDFNLQSQINRREPRTLGEVEMQAGAAAKAFSIDVKHYINAFGRLFSKIFDLWSQFGSEAYEFAYFGQGAAGESLKLTKEEIQGKYRIKIRGNDQNTNPQVKLQKAQQVLQVSLNEFLLQLGVTDPIKIAAGVGEFLKILDVDEIERFVNLQPQPQPQGDPTDQMQIMGKDMTESEIAQVLQRRGIEPDLEQRLRREKKDNLMSAAEISNKVKE